MHNHVLNVSIADYPYLNVKNIEFKIKKRKKSKEVAFYVDFQKNVC